MIGYASRTGTRRNLRALREADWRLLVSARGVLRTEGFRYGLDNGAWTAFQRGEAFDVDAFEAAVDLLGEGADWIVVPDVVADAPQTIRMAERWLPQLERFPVLLAVQNGMQADDVRPWLGPRCGIFLGGDTSWKLQTMRAWGELARERGCHYHVGRVNSARRIELCHEAGADSFDGTSVTRFADSIGRLDRAVRQSTIFSLVVPRAPDAWSAIVRAQVERRAGEILNEAWKHSHAHGTTELLFRRVA